MSEGPYGWLNRSQLQAEAERQAERIRASGRPPESLRRSELELLGELHWPQRHHTLLEAQDPGPDVALLTVANDRFVRGLEALLLSLRAVYPSLSAPVVVAHDGGLGPFLQPRLAGIHPLLGFVQLEPACGTSDRRACPGHGDLQAPCCRLRKGSTATSARVVTIYSLLFPAERGLDQPDTNGNEAHTNIVYYNHGCLNSSRRFFPLTSIAEKNTILLSDIVHSV